MMAIRPAMAVGNLVLDVVRMPGHQRVYLNLCSASFGEDGVHFPAQSVATHMTAEEMYKLGAWLQEQSGHTPNIQP